MYLGDEFVGLHKKRDYFCGQRWVLAGNLCQDLLFMVAAFSIFNIN
jgi:hypothetical protein